MKKPKLDSMGNERLSLPMRLLYSFGIGGTGTATFMLVQTFLLFVYTDVVKVNPGYIAGLFLVTRVVDAFLAPIFGTIVDSINTRWGKYRPYFLFVGIPVIVLSVFTFTDPTIFFKNISEQGKLIYVTVTYVLFSSTISIQSAPFQAILPTMTKSISDRINIGQLNSFFGMVSAMIIQAGTIPLVIAFGGNTRSSIGWAAIITILAVINICHHIAGFAFFKEKYVVPGEKQKLTLKQVGQAIFKNRMAIIALVVNFAILCSTGIRSAVTMYYLQYYFNKPSFMGIIGIGGMAATLAGVFLSGFISKKIGLKKTMVFSSVFVVLFIVAAFFAPATRGGLIFYLVTYMCGSVFYGLFTPIQATFIPAAIDYAEWKHNVKANALLGSMNGFMQSFATAVSGALVAGALALFGYQPDIQQTGTAIMGFRLLVSFIPAIFQIFMLVVLWFDLGEEKQQQISHDLKERRDKAEAANRVEIAS